MNAHTIYTYIERLERENAWLRERLARVAAVLNQPRAAFEDKDGSAPGGAPPPPPDTSRQPTRQEEEEEEAGDVRDILYELERAEAPLAYEELASRVGCSVSWLIRTCASMGGVELVGDKVRLKLRRIG